MNRHQILHAANLTGKRRRQDQPQSRQQKNKATLSITKGTRVRVFFELGDKRGWYYGIIDAVHTTKKFVVYFRKDDTQIVITREAPGRYVDHNGDWVRIEQQEEDDIPLAAVQSGFKLESVEKLNTPS